MTSPQFKIVSAAEVPERKRLAASRYMPILEAVKDLKSGQAICIDANGATPEKLRNRIYQFLANNKANKTVRVVAAPDRNAVFVGPR